MPRVRDFTVKQPNNFTFYFTVKCQFYRSASREAKLNKVNAWVNLNLCLCHKVFFSSRVALSASLTLVAHIHTPPLHEKRGSGPSAQAPDNLRAATGEWKGWSTNNVCMGGLRVSHCVPFIWAAQGLLWGSPGLQNRGEQDSSTDLRI